MSLDEFGPDVFLGWLKTTKQFFDSNRINLPGSAIAIDTILLYFQINQGKLDSAKLQQLYANFKQAIRNEFPLKGKYEKKIFNKLEKDVTNSLQHYLQQTNDFFNSSVRLEIGQQRRHSSHMVETLKSLVLREPRPNEEDEFIGLSYAYASQISGVFRYALQDCYAWEKISKNKPIDPNKVSYMEVEDLFDYYNSQGDLLYFEGYDVIVRNSIAHSNFQFDSETMKMTYINETKKEEIGATGIIMGTKKTVEYSYEQVRQMYANISSIYSLIMIMNQILMVGTCIHYLELKY